MEILAKLIAVAANFVGCQELLVYWVINSFFLLRLSVFLLVILAKPET